MKILDLGCGTKKYPKAIGLDINLDSDADIIYNLNLFPYPFRDSVFDLIIADNVLEHLDNIISVMEEISRILKPCGKIKIIVPYFRSKWAYIDPTHKHFFTAQSFSYFETDNIISEKYRYTKVRFKIEKITFNEGLKSGFIKSFFVWLANRWPNGYEYYLSHIFPLDVITFTLINLK